MPWVQGQVKPSSGLKGREKNLEAETTGPPELSRPFRPPGCVPLPSQGIGLRPQPWAQLSRPVGPVFGWL